MISPGKQNMIQTSNPLFWDWNDCDKRFGDDWPERIPAASEDPILIDDYLRILNKTGWQRTHIIQAPMSSERFHAGVVSAMQKKRILGVQAVT